MLEQLNNPLFPFFILAVVIMIGYIAARAEYVPGMIFLLFASIGVVLAVTGIGKIGMFRALLAPILILILLVKRIRAKQRLPIFYWVLIASYMLVVYISGTVNNIPLSEYRGELGMLLLAILVSLAPVKEKTYRVFMIAVVVWGLVNIVAVISTWVGINLFPGYGSLYNEGGRAIGLMRHSTMMGIYFALSVLAAQVLFHQARSGSGKLLWLAMGFLLFIGLFASLSRGAVAGWLAGFLFIQYRLGGMTPRAVVGIAFSGIIALVIVSSLGITDQMAGRFTNIEDDNSAQARIPLLMSSFNTWAEAPVIGHGIGWKDEKLRLQSHNTYFQVLVESGILGFILFVSLMWIGTRRVLRRSRPPEDGDATIAAYNTGIAAMLGAIILDGLTHSFDFLMPYWLILGFGFML